MALFKGKTKKEITEWLIKEGFTFDKKGGKPNKDKLLKVYGRYSPDKNACKTIKITFEPDMVETSYQIGTHGDWNKTAYDIKMQAQFIRNRIEQFVPFFHDPID